MQRTCSGACSTRAPHVHCMRTACAPHVHCMCTTRALHAHCMHAAQLQRTTAALHAVQQQRRSPLRPRGHQPTRRTSTCGRRARPALQRCDRPWRPPPGRRAFSGRKLAETGTFSESPVLAAGSIKSGRGRGHSLNYRRARPRLTQSLTHSLTPSPTHSLIHSPTD